MSVVQVKYCRSMLSGISEERPPWWETMSLLRPLIFFLLKPFPLYLFRWNWKWSPHQSGSHLFWHSVKRTHNALCQTETDAVNRLSLNAGGLSSPCPPPPPHPPLFFFFYRFILYKSSRINILQKGESYHRQIGSLLQVVLVLHILRAN